MSDRALSLLLRHPILTVLAFALMAAIVETPH